MSSTVVAGGNVNSKVTLGVDALTSGIPGEGALTVDQLEAWLSKEDNHVVLEIELPRGLRLGQSQMKGLEANPMTRAKIELGRQLYFDTRLSADNTVSCASCHHPQEGFARHTQFGIGIENQEGGRNSPPSYNRILSDLQFWDGRADSLEAQAVGPIANPIEMGNTHDKCVETLQGIAGYKMQFAKVFPGEGLTIGNVGKAIAAFERALVTQPSSYDYREAYRKFADLDPEDLADIKADDEKTWAEYVEVKALSEALPMSESAIRGQELFFGKKAGCSNCHVGANLADEKYHNLGVGMNVDKPDLGRFEITQDEKDKGAFKTPTIRNVALSAPYMHDGSQRTLEEVVEHYNKGGIANPWLSDKITPLNLTAQEKLDLVEFMRACTGEFPFVASGRLPE
ncbi:MAG: cytochrome c peroxidase [Fuerstiella sp.]